MEKIPYELLDDSFELRDSDASRTPGSYEMTASAYEKSAPVVSTRSRCQGQPAK